MKPCTCKRALPFSLPPTWVDVTGDPNRILLITDSTFDLTNRRPQKLLPVSRLRYQSVRKEITSGGSTVQNAKCWLPLVPPTPGSFPLEDKAQEEEDPRILLEAFILFKTF